MNISPYLFAFLLIGVVPAQAGSAKEAPPATSEAGKAKPAAKESGPHRGSDGAAAGRETHSTRRSADTEVSPKSEDRARQNRDPGTSRPRETGEMRARRKDDSKSAVKGPTLEGPPGVKGTDAGVDAIDSRITVQRTRTTEGPRNFGDLKTVVKPGVPMNFQLRHQTMGPNAASRNERNAVGLPVASSGIEGPNISLRSRPQLDTQSRLPSTVPASFVRTDTGFDRPKILQTPPSLAPAATMTRGTINGTGLVRPGSGPAIVRGPSKPMAQVNGASVRPRY